MDLVKIYLIFTFGFRSVCYWVFWIFKFDFCKRKVVHRYIKQRKVSIFFRISFPF
jgi:hypothetical protein